MSEVLPPSVDYVAAARRHYEDARLLLAKGRKANAGQLFGFTMECGLKALLVACGVVPDADGSLSDRRFRQHMPVLSDRIDAHGTLIPDGPAAQRFLAMIPARANFNDWSIDHRYYREADLPFASLPAWEAAAKEMNDMLDQANTYFGGL